MTSKPLLVACDLEGVFTPEVWINVAEKTGIPELRLTTRDIKDYDELMQQFGRFMLGQQLPDGAMLAFWDRETEAPSPNERYLVQEAREADEHIQFYLQLLQPSAS